MINRETAIVNVKAFLPDDKEIIPIINICNLEPKGDSWLKWSDSNGNYLHIKKDKTVVSNKESPTKNNTRLIKDIHFKAPINVISKNSKWALICFAESLSTNAPPFNNISPGINIVFIWFLGIDDKLRLSMFIQNEWIENQSPLITSITTLRTIVRHFDIDKYCVIKISDIKEPLSIAFAKKAWATPWPPSKNMILDMMLTYQPLARHITNDCNLLTKKDN
jgi:hypothetical protein